MTIDFNAITKMTKPFADTGDAADILDTNDTGRAGWNAGFPTETQVDAPPFRIDFNGILKRISQACISFFAGKHYKHDGTFSTAIGGYPLGAVIQRNDNNRLFLSTIDNNTNNPNTDMTGWLLIGDGGNADTVDGLHADDFALAGDYLTADNAPSISRQADNLKLSATGTNANTVITYSELIVKSGTNRKLLLSGNYTLNSAASGVNGLDSGTLAANTWYAVYVIYDVDTNTKASLMSLSATNPTLPTGYTHFARVGWIRTDGTANKYPLSFSQKGRNVTYKVAAGSNVPDAVILISTATGTFGYTSCVYSALSVANFVPPTATVIKGSLLGTTDGTGMGSSYVQVAPNTAYGAVISTNPPPASNMLWVEPSWLGFQVVVNMPYQLDLESTSIAAIVQSNDGAIIITGWEDS